MTNVTLNYKKIPILLVLTLFTALFSSQAQSLYLEGHFRDVHIEDLKLGESGINNYSRPSIVPLIDGGFVVAFSHHGSEIKLQRYNVSGEKVGDLVKVNERNGYPFATYSILLKNGNILVGWDGEDPTYQQGGYIPVGQIFEIPVEGNPQPLNGNFVMSTSYKGWQHEVATSELENGDILFCWRSRGDGLFKARVLMEDGTPRTDEFVINELNNGLNGYSQQDSFVHSAALPGGGFVISWFTKAYGNEEDIAARVYQGFENNYEPLTGDIQVNTVQTTKAQRNPVVNTFKDGFFIVYEDFDTTSFHMRKYDLAGNALGDDSPMNPNDTDKMLRYHPFVSELADGNFIVIAGSQEVPPSGGIPQNIYGQIFDEDINPIGKPFLINDDTSLNNISPFVAGLLNGKGGFAALWTNNKDGGNEKHTLGIRIYSQDLMAVEDQWTTPDLADVIVHDNNNYPSISVMLSASNGLLQAVGGIGVAVQNSNTSIMTLTGSANDITAFIQSGTVEYKGGENIFGDNADTLVIHANDNVSSGDVFLGSFPIDIEGTPDPAVIVGNNKGSVTEDRNLNEDGHLEDRGLLTISDPDGPSEEFFVETTYSSTYGEFVISANGRWSYTVDNSLEVVQDLDFGQFLTDNTTVRSVDGTRKDITITINGENELELEAEASYQTVECSDSNAEELNDWLTSIGNTGAATNVCGDISWSHNYDGQFDDEGSHGSALVTFTATDECGNMVSTSASFTVEDTTAPTISCITDITVSTDEGTCEAILVLEIPETDDNCEVKTVVNNAPEMFPLGETIVLWTATDTSGNIATCEQIITVQESEAPVANCVDSFEVPLDENGMATITPEDIDNGSSDNCGIAHITIDQTSFDCSNFGENTVIFTITDTSGNTATCESSVTVIDTIGPIISCPEPIIANSEANSCQATLILENPESTDNCGEVSVSNNAPAIFPIGETIVVWTSQDPSGNNATCEQLITIVDGEAPIANCVTSLAIQLDETGNAEITAEMIDDGSTDNCELASIEIDRTTFDCSDLGEEIIITLTVTDTSENKTTCTTTVTVEDNVAPEVNTQNITIELDANGNADISAEDIDNGSFDPCGIDTIDLDITSFDCPTLTDHQVILTVTDLTGNTASQTATVTFTAHDQDGDDIADVCDDDIDGDNIANDDDNCPSTANPSQVDLDRNGIGDVCEQVKSLSQLTIPKGISPNGDGINDTFIIGGLQNYPNNSIEFYNRRGNLVYEAKNYQNDWDGVAFGKGETLPAAPYFYVINILGDSSEIIKGWVYINY